MRLEKPLLINELHTLNFHPENQDIVAEEHNKKCTVLVVTKPSVFLLFSMSPLYSPSVFLDF
jgi:hypothetical protein